MKRYRIAVDIGGTFTDIVVHDSQTLDLFNVKVPTSQRPADAVVLGLEKILPTIQIDEISQVAHATTIATNAILGQRNLELPRTGLITTKGFRDVLEIGRQQRPELYNPFVQRPKGLVPRRYRLEVEERVGPSGEELKPVNFNDIDKAAEQIRREKIDAVAVGLLNSYVNPNHENQIKEAISKLCPHVAVLTSNSVCPEYREYERFSTAVVNVALVPLVSRYLEDLSSRFSDLNMKADLYVMQSDGGLTSAHNVTRRPAVIVESGPAAGVVASAEVSRILEIQNVLCFDMGGTTAKAGSILNHAIEMVSEYEVGGRVHKGRIVKGSGYPIRYRFVDLAECSAGGGTIAWVDAGDFLRVGPISAGANPGPASYGLGGEEPTVTDANLILGRLNPEYFLGGKMTLNVALAKKAMEEKICNGLGLDAIQAALGIIRLVNAEMAKILRIVSLERGHDPRKCTLFAFGGAGPMHACYLAEDLSINSIIIPQYPGLFSAKGLLTAEITHNQSRSFLVPASEVDPHNIENYFRTMENETKKTLAHDALKGELRIERSLDLRYMGQSYDLEISTSKPFDQPALANALKAFHQRHNEIHGFSTETEMVELVACRITSRIRSHKPIEKKSVVGSRFVKEKTSRRIFVDGTGNSISCKIFLRENLQPSASIVGPAIVEQPDSTTVISSGWTALVDEYLNMKLSRELNKDGQA